MSWGVPGLRFGVSPSGRKYISFGIPGTGLYFIKYLSSSGKTQAYPTTQKRQPSTQPPINTNTPQNKTNPTQGKEPWWKQKNLLE